ncbi:hypothetical protein [Haloprofundus sp. MHR1]|uniref:hypothetical protein n=1 Tax=Haloprofundus sp. MHR1 TaxID=2572921 RepID=UPI0010BE586B|nr:hypothetical protein [Haloprofundus sp. MHR1]QCJ48205.1 hypothetical protein FCF25_14200 [Haloprofundus sp. MHR1]
MSEKLRAFISGTLYCGAFFGGLWKEVGDPFKMILIELQSFQSQGPYAFDALQSYQDAKFLLMVGGIVGAFVFLRFLGVLAYGIAHAAGLVILSNLGLGVALLTISSLTALFAYSKQKSKEEAKSLRTYSSLTSSGGFR